MKTQRYIVLTKPGALKTKRFFFLLFFFPLIRQRLTTLQEIEDEPLDYEPYLYADEGELDTLSELETITISDDDSLEKALNELDSKFNQLASICQN